ncbi:RNA polymerase sigma factor [Actinomadura rubrisoli]|uniref:Sigma-70 family RNA polymerase sigma factor n=1 Tax=Actinomadura rubrisoli TaxID=2530368 RepID=A0A4R5A1V8_9ACTN|nr:sigma-70 family RNA polymerase sigma factor [Actinomadura rubrisoli]TDD64624.1 sigma-70 family RNA polymerase sigma factor [Actinomadura rubrisoli]
MFLEDLDSGEAAALSRSALGELFAAHYPRLVGLAGLLGADDPEDVAQEAFARLQGRGRALRRPETAPAYLRATVCNLVRNRRRHLRLARLRQPPPPDPAAAAEHVVLDRESHRELIGALDGLSRRQREALVLRYWLDLTDHEVAEAMDVSPGSAKTHIRRGLAALQRALGGASA